MPRPPHTDCRVGQPQADQIDARPDVLVAQRAAEEWGVLTIDELRACELNRQAVLVRVRNGRLHRIHRGVFAVGHANLTLEGRFLAAVKACGPGAVLSHFSAAALWEIVAWDDRYVQVTVPGESTRIHRRVRAHRSAQLEVPDVWHHH